MTILEKLLFFPFTCNFLTPKTLNRIIKDAAKTLSGQPEDFSSLLCSQPHPEHLCSVFFNTVPTCVNIFVAERDKGLFITCVLFLSPP